MKYFKFVIIVVVLGIASCISAKPQDTLMFVEDRNCVLVVDFFQKTNGRKFSHGELVMSVINTHFETVRVVKHETDGSPVDMVNALTNSPCKSVNISMLYSRVSEILGGVRLPEDTTYFVSSGNRVSFHRKHIEKNGLVTFNGNVIIVAGSNESGSISCEFVKKTTYTTCLTQTKYGAGIHIYKGEVFNGSSFASPTMAAMEITEELTEGDKIVSSK